MQNIDTNDLRPELGMQHSMRLFRAQRNFYISGFAIFLTLVIRRMILLISAQATLLAQSEASMRQAQSATTAARTLLSQQKANEIKPKDDDKTPSAPTEEAENKEEVSVCSCVLYLRCFRVKS